MDSQKLQGLWALIITAPALLKKALVKQLRALENLRKYLFGVDKQNSKGFGTPVEIIISAKY